MAAVDQRTLRALAENSAELRRLELGGIEKTRRSYRLGAVAIDHERPRWSYGISGALTDTSHFRKLPFVFDDLQVRGVAAIFHVADHPDGRRHATEYLAGWVPRERAEDLDHWLAWLNAHVHELLYDAAREAAGPQDFDALDVSEG